MTIFRFRSAHWESLWTLTHQRQWPLSFREFIQLRQQLWALRWRLLKAGRHLSYPPHRTNALARILRLLQVFFNIFRSYLRRNVRGIYIYCAQRGVPPLAARPSPEKFFIVSMIMAMRKRITPTGTMLFVYNIRLLLAGDVD